MAAAETIRIALAQINPTVGDLEGNARKIGEWIERARDEGASIVVFPELCVPGYPAEDLYLKPNFLAANQEALEAIAADVDGIEALVGYAEPRTPEGLEDRRAHNTLALLADGEVRALYHKIHLPNYGVFDERRYFTPGDGPGVEEAARVKVGLTICEDIWVPGDPEAAEVVRGARLIVNASASPYHRGKGLQREDMVSARAKHTEVPIALCNTVGGQDELVFDGHSFIADQNGKTIARAPQFEEALLVHSVPLRGAEGPRHIGLLPRVLPPSAEIYEALCLGLRDYVNKNGFEHVVIALSGGIDSALVAILAADALGAERVTCVTMPSPYSSPETRADAVAIAENLGTDLLEITIEETMDAYEAALAETFAGTEPGLAEENLQARIRGNVVMALSNRFDWLVLTTGNKSEMAVGYATLYGDMAGGFAVIKDVPKTSVYELVRHRNAQAASGLVPPSVLDREPSAELRHEQKDTDSLPPYDILDRILEAYIERDEGPEEIAARGDLDPETVAEVIRLVDRAEYKRRQAPPGIKITTRSFGRDRRLPITNAFNDAQAWAAPQSSRG